MNKVTAISTYEEAIDKISKENADVAFIMEKIGVNNVSQDPSHQIWEKMVRIMVKSGQLTREMFK